MSEFDPFNVEELPDDQKRPGVYELLITINDLNAGVPLEAITRITQQYATIWDYDLRRTFKTAYDMKVYCDQFCLPLRVVFNPCFRLPKSNIRQVQPEPGALYADHELGLRYFCLIDVREWIESEMTQVIRLVRPQS